MASMMMYKLLSSSIIDTNSNAPSSPPGIIQDQLRKVRSSAHAPWLPIEEGPQIIPKPLGSHQDQETIQLYSILGIAGTFQFAILLSIPIQFWSSRQFFYVFYWNHWFDLWPNRLCLSQCHSFAAWGLWSQHDEKPAGNPIAAVVFLCLCDFQSFF